MGKSPDWKVVKKADSLSSKLKLSPSIGGSRFDPIDKGMVVHPTDKITATLSTKFRYQVREEGDKASSGNDHRPDMSERLKTSLSLVPKYNYNAKAQKYRDSRNQFPWFAPELEYSFQIELGPLVRSNSVSSEVLISFLLLEPTRKWEDYCRNIRKDHSDETRGCP
jgi:hypothetical protein